MNQMSTTCPNCKLQLAVTPSDLRVGQGYVRCGRCERVFNALVSLTEDAEGESAPVAAATGTDTLLALVDAPAQDGLPQDALPPLEAPTPDELTAIPSMPDDMDVVETVGTGTFETIVLEGNGMSQTEEHVDASMIDQELQQLAARMEAARGMDFPDDETGDDIPQDILLELTEPLDEATLQSDEPATFRSSPRPQDDLLGDPPPHASAHRGWKAAAALLVFALLMQLVHHNRRDLVTKAWAGPLIRPLYSALGHPLEPDWTLSDYALHQLGGEAPSFAKDQIIVRASVQNRAPNPQPPPVVRVTLQDRFGNALATHDVAPQNYLRTTPPRRLAPDQRLDAELVLEDPGGKAAGFELDACLPDSVGRLHCAGRP
ncbi:MAG: hypothetical protein RL030_1484 [Pseudomonadota bacterium]|jgi:predicted Zn finger-like uncharacterized protein